MVSLAADARLLSGKEKCTQQKPAVFIENKGQFVDEHKIQRPDIQYKLQQNDISVFIGNGAVHYQWCKAAHSKGKKIFETYRLDMKLAGANENAELVPDQPDAYYENYYLPQCPDGAIAHSCKKLTYKNVYPNIDWVLYVNSSQDVSQAGNVSSTGLEYDFIVHPGGDASLIKIQYNGAEQLTCEKGALKIKTPLGSITEAAPVSYELETGRKIRSAFRLEDGIVSFDVPGEFKTLVIDPSVNWISYYGGSFTDVSSSITVDFLGNIIMAGQTNSLNNMITGVNVQQVIFGGFDDAFIVKFDYVTQSRIFATYYGGTEEDRFTSVACDKTGNIYAGGGTSSRTGIASAVAFQDTFGGENVSGFYGDGMLVKFSLNGSRIWGTYFGGEGQDEIFGICTDPLNNVYATGVTISSTGISSPGAYKSFFSQRAGRDAFIARFSSTGERRWATYYGDTSDDYGIAVATDFFGNLYVTGGTASPVSLGTPNVHQPDYAGNRDVYLARFDTLGQRVWGTYFGGNGREEAGCITFDQFGGGSIYIGGNTNSFSNISTAGVQQPNNGGGSDGYIAKFDLQGNRIWGSYYGGPSFDGVTGLSVNSLDRLYVVGETNSFTGISTTGAFKLNKDTSSDAFIARWTNIGTRQWGSYLGGTFYDVGQGVVCSTPGFFVAMAGYTFSEDLPTTPGTFQEAYGNPSGGGSDKDGFLAVINDDPPDPITLSPAFSDTVRCQGDSLHMQYFAISFPPTFATTNLFSVELSDKNGNFGTSPVIIGQRMSPFSGIINCLIPYNTPPGKHYRVRVSSSLPVIISADNGTDISISSSPYPVLASSPKTTLCEHDTIRLLAADTATNVQYIWTGPANFTSIKQNVTLPDVLKDADGDYYVTAYVNSCIARDKIHIRVVSVPKLTDISYNGPLCSADTLKLNVTDAETGGKYSWTGPEGFIDSVPNPVKPRVQTGATGTYHVLAQIEQCSADTFIQVLVTQIPLHGGFYTNAPVCAGDSLKLNAVNDTHADQFTWKGPANFTSDLQNNVIVHPSLNNAGKYYLQVYRGNCKVNDSIDIHIKPPPVVVASSNAPIMEDSTLLLFAGTDQAGCSFSWTGPDNYTSAEQNPTMTNAPSFLSGDYYVTATLNGCANTDSIYVFISDSTADYFQLFPNPNKGVFTIAGNVKTKQAIPILVTDELGRVIYQDKISPLSRRFRKLIQLPGYLPNAVYHLTIRRDGVGTTAAFTILK